MAAQDLLTRANRFWNSAISYHCNSTVVDGNDAIKNGGDCNDYVINKAGTITSPYAPDAVPADKLSVGIGNTADGELHSVLLVDIGDGDPLVLDNRTDDIVPLSQKTDLDIRDRIAYSTFRSGK